MSKYVVWVCQDQKSKNPRLKPAGKEPQEGCMKPSCMRTKHDTLPSSFQSSPCSHEGCTKRIRLNAGNSWVFDNKIEAIEFIGKGDFQ